MQWTKTFTVATAVFGLLLFAATSFAEVNVGAYRGSKLIGADVENAQGEDLGDIVDIVIDPQTGRMQYAVLSFGGFLGLGEKYFAIPWEALKREPGQRMGDTERYVLNIDKERLKNAPGFDKNNWPNMADRGWAKTVYTFYDVTPYWEQREARMHDPATGTQVVHRSAAVAATVHKVDPSSKMITIKTSNNEMVEMQAPAEMLTTLQAGDRVEVVIRKHDMTSPPATTKPSSSEPARPAPTPTPAR
jgi:sporulation protein YlmC with PRC-barrel domain/Cu/Ag efflux protein CusF